MDLTSVSSDSITIHDGVTVLHYDGLHPSTAYELNGFDVQTLPDLGEQFAVVCTVNDTHFGETESGKIDGSDIGPVMSVAPGEVPYPEVMNHGAATDIAALSPDVVVAKGDLTSDATPEEINAFFRCYGEPFGDSLVYTLGNHDMYSGAPFAHEPMIERSVDGAVLAVLNTARTGSANGELSEDQLEWLDELASRSTEPVLVFGHHPVWDVHHDERSDDFFGLVPESTEALAALVQRRANIAGYFAGHTHRNRVIHLPGCGSTPFVEVGCVKDFPGMYAEYRVCDRGIAQVGRRIGTPDALRWSERCRGMFFGTYGDYAFGELTDRCFAFDGNGLLLE